MNLAATIPTALAAAAVLAAATPADAATGVIHTWQAATQGRTAIHGAVDWQTDKNLGDITVGAWLQHHQRHGWGPITWWTWDRTGRAAWQETSTRTSGALTVWAYCRTGTWRVHVDTLEVDIEAHGAVAVPVHITHNSRVLRVRSCR